MSEYANAYPAVRDFFDGAGWKSDSSNPGEGLLWVVRTQESIDRRNNEERQIAYELMEGTRNPSTVIPPTLADEYVVADRLELREGHLVFSLGSSQHNVAVKVYAPGYWREFHLLSEPKEIARRTATMLREDDDA